MSTSNFMSLASRPKAASSAPTSSSCLHRPSNPPISTTPFPMAWAVVTLISGIRASDKPSTLMSSILMNWEIPPSATKTASRCIPMTLRTFTAMHTPPSTPSATTSSWSTSRPTPIHKASQGSMSTASLPMVKDCGTKESCWSIMWALPIPTFWLMSLRTVAATV